MRSLLSFVAAAWLACGAVYAQVPVSPAAPSDRWFKGNTHAHTLNSDGDSTADEVVRWYREQRYHFLVLTDHNLVTTVDGLNGLFGAENRFLVIPGEEISDRAGDKPVHVNALGARTTILPPGGASVAEVLRRDVAAAQAGHALAQVNHPNFGWAISPADLPASQSPLLLEIYNGHPQVNNIGGGEAPGAEALWDRWLSAGARIFGVASDDTHDLKRPWSRQAASPGRGWVMVRARQLTSEAILDALARGDFYASTGVELADWQVTPRSVSIAVKTQGTTRYRVQFIGQGGAVLAEETAAAASYSFTGSEGYVRVKVTDSNGWSAWTQPAPVAAPGAVR